MFRRYTNYLKYVLTHKYYVLIECYNNGILWRGIMHDMSKFRLSEFIPYAQFFYNPDGTSTVVRDDTGYYKPTDTGKLSFDIAWLKHTRRNPHHWQYWILSKDDGGVKILDMPDEYITEMICDWYGASQTQGHGRNIIPWYEKNKNNMILSEHTRKKVENIIYDR